MVPITVRIRAQGQLSPADWQELPGFVEGAVDDDLVLWGTVPDQAALLGILARLHRAGVRVHDVERVLLPSSATELDVSGSACAGAFVARIQLTGHVAACLSGVQGADAVTEDSASTTIEVRLREEEDLHGVLSVLESLALQVLEVHVRLVPMRGGATMC